MSFKVIVADPPWPTKNIVRTVRPNQKKDLPYPTMTLDAIKSLSIPDLPATISDLSATDSVLFLWTTHAFLEQSFEVMRAWGFRYQRILTWDKANGLCFYGFHHRTEFCLFGYKGRIAPFPKKKAFPTFFKERGRRHSQKPEVFFELVERSFEGPYLELFARTKREGWISWGNELDTVKSALAYHQGEE